MGGNSVADHYSKIQQAEACVWSRVPIYMQDVFCIMAGVRARGDWLDFSNDDREAITFAMQRCATYADKMALATLEAIKEAAEMLKGMEAIKGEKLGDLKSGISAALRAKH